MSVSPRWERPSPRVAELIRSGAQLLLDAPEEVFAEVDAAVLSDPDSPITTDPVLAEAVRRNNRFNLLRWAESNVRDPGAPVVPQLAPDALAVARDFVRRGLDITALQAYRVGQNVGWQRWMELAFALTSRPEELQEMLEVSARSIFAYVDGTLALLAEQTEHEREQLRRGTHAQRLETVTLILEGAPIAQARASARLGYPLAGGHTAAVVWSEAAEVDAAALQAAAEAVGRAAGTRPLIVLASASALWVWTSGEVAPPAELIRDQLSALEEVRVALGSPGRGLRGFRRSHLDALATQRLMHRTLPQLRLATYSDVQVVALATQDDERAEEFVRQTLGDLASDPGELRDTLRTYLREEYNAARTARVLFAHRNTVLARLARIEKLLPAPLTGRGLQVALALEILRWRRTPPP